MLGINELNDLLEEIQHRVIEANRKGTLEELLEAWGMKDLVHSEAPKFESYKTGKIVVIGQSEVKEEMLKQIANKAGIDKNRFEFCLDYEQTKSYNYRKLQYEPLYRVVLVGPTPHKTEGTGESSSVIAEMENGEGYPRVIRLMAGEKLKITKTNFKNALADLLSEGYIE